MGLWIINYMIKLYNNYKIVYRPIMTLKNKILHLLYQIFLKNYHLLSVMIFLWDLYRYLKKIKCKASDKFILKIQIIIAIIIISKNNYNSNNKVIIKINIFNKKSINKNKIINNSNNKIIIFIFNSNSSNSSNIK